MSIKNMKLNISIPDKTPYEKGVSEKKGEKKEVF